MGTNKFIKEPVFKDLTETLNLSNDDFIRTTEERHKRSAINIWKILEKKGEIYLNIIPYTWKKTNLNKLKVGDRINLEVDMLARYVTQNR